MGQPKFQRKNYQTPNHPWQGDRIKSENEVRVKFGLKNKKEIWRAQTRLREIRQQARTLVSATRNPDDLQAKREADLLLKRLHRQGYVGDDATLNDVLGLDLERILNRRLQSQVYLKGMARTPKQARQFVSHGLIVVGDRRVKAPSYIVRRDEEELIHINPDRSIADENHPIRPQPEGVEVPPAAEPAKDEGPTDKPVDASAQKAAEPVEPEISTAEAKEEGKPDKAPATAKAPEPAQVETPAPEAVPEPEPAKEEAKPETPTKEPKEEEKAAGPTKEKADTPAEETKAEEKPAEPTKEEAKPEAPAEETKTEEKPAEPTKEEAKPETPAEEAKADAKEEEE